MARWPLRQACFARGLDPIGCVPLGQALEPAARAEAVLGVAALGEDRAHQRERARADRRRPCLDLADRFLGVLAVRRGHVIDERGRAADLEAPHVRRHPLGAE